MRGSSAGLTRPRRRDAWFVNAAALDVPRSVTL